MNYDTFMLGFIILPSLQYSQKHKLCIYKYISKTSLTRYFVDTEGVEFGGVVELSRTLQFVMGFSK